MLANLVAKVLVVLANLVAKSRLWLWWKPYLVLPCRENILPTYACAIGKIKLFVHWRNDEWRPKGIDFLRWLNALLFQCEKKGDSPSGINCSRVINRSRRVIERKIIHLRRKKKLRRGHRSLAGGIKIEPACYISDFKCDLTALSDELTTSCFSLEEIYC